MDTSNAAVDPHHNIPLSALSIDDAVALKRVFIFEPQEAIRDNICTLCRQEGLTPCLIDKGEFIDFIANPLGEFKEVYLLIIGDIKPIMAFDVRDIIDRLRQSRPSMPIIARVSEQSEVDALQEQSCSGVMAYTSHDLDRLRQHIHSVESFAIPPILTFRVLELLADAINAVFCDVTVSYDSPYVVLDDMLSGALLGMANIRSQWCQGSIHIEASEEGINRLVAHNKTSLDPNTDSIDKSQTMVSELTNMVVGRLKSDLFSDGDYTGAIQEITLPIIINHKKQIVKFASLTPQICFRFSLSDDQQTIVPCEINVKLVFNISFDPEKCAATIKALLEAGPNGPEKGTIELL